MASYTKDDLEEFYDGYTEEALRALAEEYQDDEDVEVYDVNVSQRAEDRMVADCKRFLDRAWPVLGSIPRVLVVERTGDFRTLHSSGYDFYRTRNDRGASFWNLLPDKDRAQLVALAKRFGPSSLRVTTTGRIEVQ